MAEKVVVTLEYCVPWNYVDKAVRAADDILSNYQHIIDTFTFIMGTKGVFDVKVNGDMVYSKHDMGRHAEEGEVLRLFRDYVGTEVPTYPK